MRSKIIAGNLVAVLALGLLSYGIVRSRVRANLGSELESKTYGARQLFERSWRLSSIDFLTQVQDRASHQSVSQVFAGLDEQSRRRRAYEALELMEVWFKDSLRGRGGSPDFAAIVDETGRVVSRNKDINRMYGELLSQRIPSLARVLSTGRPQDDVWSNMDGKLAQVASAPVFGDRGGVIGALVVAYELSNGVAQREAQAIGREVAFLSSDRVYSSSLPQDAMNGLKSYWSHPPSSTSIWTAELGADSFVGVTGALPGAPAGLGYALLANESKFLGLADPSNIILLLTVLAAIMVIAYGSMLGTNFITPIEQIEEGVLRVINGDTNYRLNVESEEFGGLAYRVNQLINVFTGVSEEDTDGRIAPPAVGSGSNNEGEST